MYITQEELQQRLNKTELLVKERERKTRGSVKTNNPENRLTHEERVLIGILEDVDTQKNVAELMGVSVQTVSNVSRGLVSPTVGVDKELKEDVDSGIKKVGESTLENNKRIQEQLVSNLAAALGHVGNNIHTAKVADASKIAVDMSRILHNVSGGGDKDRGGHKTAIIINVPSMKEEKAYKTITV